MIGEQATITAGPAVCRLQHTEAASSVSSEPHGRTSSTRWPLYGVIGKSKTPLGNLSSLASVEQIIITKAVHGRNSMPF